MKKYGRQVVKRTMIALAVSIASMSSAYALKADTHVWVGQQVINDLARDRAVTIRLNGRLIKIAPPADVIDAILQNQKEYLMGNIGPDASPDIIVGQGIVHPGAKNAGDWGSHEWLQYLINNSRTNPVGKAYTYGYVGHAAADMFAHTYVNQYAGDAFDLGGEQLVEARHMALEAFIAKLTPPIADHNGTPLGTARALVQPKAELWPYLRDTLVMNDTVADQYMRRPEGKHLAAYHEFRKVIASAATDPVWNKVDNGILRIVASNYNISLSKGQAQSILDTVNNRILPALNSGIDNVQGWANEVNTTAINADQRVFNVVMSHTTNMVNLNTQLINLHNEILSKTATIKPLKNCPWYMTSWDCDILNKSIKLHNSTVNATISVLNSTVKTKQTELLQTAKAVRDSALATHNFLVVITDAQIDLAQRFGSNTSPVTSLLNGWGKDVDVAMTEYVKAASQVIINSTDPTLSGTQVIQPVADWFRCYHLSIIGVPQELGGCAVTDAAKKAFDAMNRMVLLIDSLGSMNSVVGLPSPVEIHDWKDRQIDGAKNRLISYAARTAEEMLPTGIKEMIAISHQDMTDAALNSHFTTTELRVNKRLLMIPDMAARVRAEMKITNGYFDPQGYAVVADAVQLAKLSLLDKAGLAVLAEQAGVAVGADGQPLFAATDNVVAGAFANIDGNHQWMSGPPPRPNDGSATYAPVSSYAAPAGFVPWRPAVRQQLFRSLFTGPLSPGIDAPGITGFSALLKPDYPYRPSLANPFPDDLPVVVEPPPVTMTTLVHSSAALNFGTVARGGARGGSITVTNTGAVPATGLSFPIEANGHIGEFMSGGGTCGTTLANGASCTVNVYYYASCTTSSLTGTLSSTGTNVATVRTTLSGTTASSGMCL